MPANRKSIRTDSPIKKPKSIDKIDHVILCNEKTDWLWN